MTRTRFALLALFAPLVPHGAAAQVPLYPNTNVPSAPTTLDPGETGSQAPAPPPPPTPAPAPAQQQPNVVVVKPDGTMQVSGPQPTEPNGYYDDDGAAIPSGDQPPQGDVGDEGPVPEVHRVVRGDTLWDICQRYFNDPWQWPKIWSYNPQITNPHWIYPGDYVRLLPRGQFASQPDTGPATDTGPAQPSDNLPPPERRSEVALRQTAFVEKGDLDASMKIDGSVDEKVLLGTGDSVYLSYPKDKPPQVGQRYSIYTPEHTVSYNGKDVGAFVHILGTIEVASVKQDKRARAVIVTSDQEIERGNLVGPLVKEFKTMPPTPAEVDAKGTIVALLHPFQLIGQGELVFVDLGAQSGLKVGNRMVVVRRGDALPPKMDKTIGQDDQRYPARELGEVMIVQVGKSISAGLVTVAVQEMGVGDLVIMQKAE